MVLDLNSPRWAELKSAVGDGRLVAQRLQELAESGERPVSPQWGTTRGLWVEILEDIGHQFTRYSSAYAALPHLIEAAFAHRFESDPQFLHVMGSLAAPYGCIGDVPQDLAPEFAAGLERMAKVALDALGTANARVFDYDVFVFAAAALTGRTQLSRSWFSISVNDDGSAEAGLDCPSCHRYLLGEFDDGALVFKAVDQYQRPQSEGVTVTPLRSDGTASPNADFDWLTSHVHSDQKGILSLLPHLFGTVSCPLCKHTFDVMTAIDESHGTSADV
jgi:hypothetical protein